MGEFEDPSLGQSESPIGSDDDDLAEIREETRGIQGVSITEAEMVEVTQRCEHKVRKMLQGGSIESHEAMDIVQEAWRLILEGRRMLPESVPSCDRIYVGLIGTARSVISHRRKAADRRGEVSVDAGIPSPGVAESPLHKLQREETIELLRDEIGNPRNREIDLRIFDLRRSGATYQEICRVLAISRPELYQANRRIQRRIDLFAAAGGR